MIRVVSTFSLSFLILLLVAPQNAYSQMRDFEQGMMGMKNKLSTTIFDGEQLHITRHEQLQDVKAFGTNYRKNLKKAIDAWKELGRGQNKDRLGKLKANKAYYDALIKAYNVKSKEIQAPVKAKPVQARAITLEEIYIGPDVGKDEPVIIDTVGEYDTEIKVYGHPGTKAKPTRWRAMLNFYVKYASLAHDDTVMIDVLKDGKSLGEPTPCQADKRHVLVDSHLAHFKCEAPNGRDYEKQFTTDGVHTIRLTYKKLIEGKEFKDFAVFRVNAIKQKQGAANDPSLKWGTNHDMKLTVSTLAEQIPHSTPTDGGIRFAIQFAQQKTEAFITARTWFKRDKGYHRTKMTCLFNGKRIDEVEGHKGPEYSAWSYRKKGSPERDDQQWTQHYYELRSIHPRPNPDGSKMSYSKPQHYLNENPGEYRCVITGDGEVLKELFFTVGADGDIVKPACQLQSMNTVNTVMLLAAKDHKFSTVDFDQKLGMESGFEGRVNWSSGCPPVK